MVSMSSQVPLDLSRKILKAGYYPAFVTDVLDIALADERVETHLVHLETTFDVESKYSPFPENFRPSVTMNGVSEKQIFAV